MIYVLHSNKLSDFEGPRTSTKRVLESSQNILQE